MWPIVQPAASTMARTFSRACLVCAPTSPTATVRPSPIPTCPATTTISPPGATMPWEYIPRGGPKRLGVTTVGMVGGMAGPPPSAQPDVFEILGLAVDAARGRRDPAGHLAALGHRLHQAAHVGLVLLGRQPVAMPRIPFRLADDAAVGRHPHLREGSDGAAEGAMRQREGEVHAVTLDDLVPAVHPALAVGDVVVPQPLVERDQRRLLAGDDLLAVEADHRVDPVLQAVIVGLLGLLEAPLEPRGVEVGGIGRDLGAEEVERDRAVEVDVLLQRGQVDPAV